MGKIFALFILTASMNLLHAQGVSNQNQQGSSSQSTGSMQYNNQVQPGVHNQGAQGQYGTQGHQNSGVTDQMLNSQIQNLLSSSQYQNRFSNVTATVNTGNVTLQGTVSSQDDKDALGALIGGINGIRSVYNQVTLQSSSQESSNGGGYPNNKAGSQNTSSKNY